MEEPAMADDGRIGTELDEPPAPAEKDPDLASGGLSTAKPPLTRTAVKFQGEENNHVEDREIEGGGQENGNTATGWIKAPGLPEVPCAKVRKGQIICSPHLIPCLRCPGVPPIIGVADASRGQATNEAHLVMLIWGHYLLL